MNIVHIDMTGTFNEEMTYQEPMLAKYNFRDGHRVTMIATCFRWDGSDCLKVLPQDIITKDGYRLIRLPYLNIGNSFFSDKIRATKGLYDLLVKLGPDVIVVHCAHATLSTLDVIKYTKRHMEVVLYADTHTDYKNSGRNWASLNLLHKIFYRNVVRQALPYIKKYFYVTQERKRFACEVYKIPEAMMEFYPLGGELISHQAKAAAKEKIRAELGMASDELLLLHSGKLDALKKTDILLEAFARVPSQRLRLIIIGSVTESFEPILKPYLQNDSRILFLGWKTGKELMEYLAASDMYLQPGSQSATLENALCCGTPIMIYPHESYDKHYLCGNGFYVEDADDIMNAFYQIVEDNVNLEQMSDASFMLAEMYFDYKKLAARLYQ